MATEFKLSYTGSQINEKLGQVDNKVDKVSGKGLSTNDFTTDEKNKLAGIAAGANAYTHPNYTAKSSGLYKVAVDSTGHVSGATAVTKADITGLGIPAQDTTYTHPSTHPASMITGLDSAISSAVGNLGYVQIATGSSSTSTTTDTTINLPFAPSLIILTSSNKGTTSALIGSSGYLYYTNWGGYGTASGTSLAKVSDSTLTIFSNSFIAGYSVTYVIFKK